MHASAASRHALLRAQAVRACGQPILSGADAEGRQTWVAPLAGATHREFTNMATKGVEVPNYFWRWFSQQFTRLHESLMNKV